jgi:hypothetical protein
MSNGRYLKYVNDRLFEVVKSYKVNQMIVPKRHPDKIDQQLLGLYVKYHDGNHVLREGDKLLICREVEDAQIIEDESKIN